MAQKYTVDEMRQFLFAAGWQRKRYGWRHETLMFSWPLEEAFRLQLAADRGARGLVCKDLRAWRQRQGAESVA